MNANTLADLIEKIASDVFDHLTPEEFVTIRGVEAADDMIQFHHTAGMNIRNEYSLWKHKWTPVIVNGVDMADDHPDAISAKILELVWEKVHHPENRG